MSTMKVRTRFPTAVEAQADRRWWLLDAAGVPVGRLATVAARLLMGKDKPSWTPFLDAGDFVVVVNCEQVLLTGRKEKDKIYRRHSGYPGGLIEAPAWRLRSRHPDRLVEEAVLGMLPKTRLGRAMGSKLKVHAGPDHPHAAQGPEAVDLAALAARAAAR